MTAEQLARLVERYGVSCRIRGNEVLVQACLFCGNDRWNLELNAGKGVFHCWACSEGGRLDTLLGDQFGVFDRIPVNLDQEWEDRKRPATAEVGGIDFQPVIKSEHAWNYLKMRGMVLSEAIRYRIGVCLDEKREDWFGRIIFPLREYWVQSSVGVVGRLLPGLRGSKWRAIGVRTVVGIRNPGSRMHCLVEGILDGMAAARWGWNAAIVQGKPDPLELVAWASLVPPTDGICILFDADAAEYARNLYHVLTQVHPHDRIFHVTLEDGQDPGDLLKQQAQPKFVTELDNCMESLGRVT